MGTDSVAENAARYNIKHNVLSTTDVVEQLLDIIDTQARRIELLEEDETNA